ncbi:Fic family protein [Rhodococcus sp. NPDC080181]|uniref:Fic family protein n=1 Tax=Rhodococcus sp. NPDC080181 TaxID=3155292 RepID=UPI00344F44EC
MTRPEQHPYISFEIDTKRITPAMWLALGEAMSKCQHLAGVPLKPARAAEMSSVYLARGVQATTAIEGNTLSEKEVKQIVAMGTAHVGKSRQYQEREVQNVLGAIAETDEALRAGEKLPVTRARLESLNAQILDGIPDEPEVVPGMLRRHNVSAGRYLAPHYDDVPGLINRFVQWLTDLRGQVAPDAPVQDRFVNAVLAAMLAHLYIAWIHPFGNGNGRLARLIEVQILSESGVVPIVATNLLSDHYNKTRDHGYYRALDAAQGDVFDFVRYALDGFLDELREQIEVVKAENVQIHWESYVYEVFRTMPDTETRTRQRELALVMPEERWITAKEATDLNTQLARLYARVGERTPTRDLNDLTRLDLVIKVGRKYRAKRGVIQAFIPPTWEAPATPPLMEELLADTPPNPEPTLFDE